MPAARPAAPPSRGNVEFTKVVALFYIGGTLALLAGIGGSLANLAYLVLAVATGLLLYLRDQGAYVSFSLWLWFITPFVRRVLDMRHGWSPTSIVLIAPLAVALLAAFTVLHRLRELRGMLYAPFLLVLLAFGYGFSVGAINAGVVPAMYALTTWLAPATFGLYVAINWRRYPEFANAVRRTFTWALPLLAAYGIYQFVVMPRWDAQWMINAGLRSIGAPRPFLARVYGTLNTPGPFAAFLCAGSLMLLPQKGRLRFVGIGIAILSLLLTRTRAAWAAFVIGLVVQQFGQPLKQLPKYAITLIAVALIAIPVARMPQFSALILPRIQTFANLSEDNSFVKRYNFSETAAAGIVETAEGNGLGTTGGAIKLRGSQGVRSLDNGFLEIFYIYGWVGGVLFFLGIGGLVLQSARFRETRSDQFANAVRAIAVALVSMLPIG
ncbi:MAG TPA: hypothetical protein VG916_11440, partial [Gemmatimonadaceae bacterium]|nr:hypothetical protein [Gemmatimonadaceae bacterium]